MSCNVFLWIITLILTVQFFCYDYTAGTVKLPIAYGISRVKVYLAKVIVIILYYMVCYVLFNAITLGFTCYWGGYVPCFAELIQYFGYIGLNFLVMVPFILLCLTVCICLKNTGIIATVLCVWLNPLYYWLNMGTFRLEYGLVYEIMIYFVFGLLFLLPLSVLLVRKQEFK